MSKNLTGVIGRFLPEEAYKVEINDEDKSTGVFFYKGESVGVALGKHAHKNCWTMKSTDAQALITNTSK